MGLCLPATATKEMAWMSVAARGQRAPETSCSASWVSDSWPFAVEMYLEIQSGNTVEGHPSLGEKKKKEVLPVFPMMYAGLHQQRRGTGQGRDFVPLLCPHKDSPAVLHPYLGPQTKDRRLWGHLTAAF